MISSATNAQRQIAVTEGAEDFRARRIDCDVFALKADGTISRFKPLASTRATMRPGPSRVNSGLHFCLRQRNSRANIDADVYASTLDKNQRAGHSGICHKAKSFSGCREVSCIEAPITAEIDGKAATINMCHGRL